VLDGSAHAAAESLRGQFGGGFASPSLPRRLLGNGCPLIASLTTASGCEFLAKLLRKLEARVGIEPTHKGFADLSLTAWVPRLGRADLITL
jgi:hypothetical protein